MTSTIAAISNADDDLRWRNWRAEGVDADRRSAASMRKVVVFIAIAWAIAVVIQFV